MNTPCSPSTDTEGALSSAWRRENCVVGIQCRSSMVLSSMPGEAVMMMPRARALAQRLDVLILDVGVVAGHGQHELKPGLQAGWRRRSGP